MRKIKFRVWDGEKIVIPDYITRDGIAYWKENSIREWARNNIMQYTGLKDKNGKECYDGDIIFSTGHGNKIIEWIDKDAAFGFKSNSGFTRLFGLIFEIIGNIYENPELLK